MDEESANLGGVMTRVEEVVVTVGPLVCAVKRFAFAPAAAGDDQRRGLRFRRAVLDDQVCAVGNELRIDTENGGQRAFHLRGTVILGLEPADGSVDERAEDGKIREKCGTDAEAGLHDGALRQTKNDGNVRQRFHRVTVYERRFVAPLAHCRRRG